MTNVEPQVIEMDTLRFSPTAILFKGARFSGTQATSFIVATPPGGGVGLHIAGLGIQSIRTPVRSPLAKAYTSHCTSSGRSNGNLSR